MRLLLSTCPEAEAETLAQRLVEEKVVACVNIIPGLKSLYWWKGNLEKDKEALLLLKTTDAKAALAISKLKEYHSYEVPEILSLEITEGNDDYFHWVEDVTRA